MKKLSFLFAIAFMTLTATATFAQEIEESVQEEVQQEKVEVAIADLPEAITNAIAADFADYTADKAYKGSKDEQEVYWVKLTGENGTIKVLFNANGEVLEQEDVQL